MSAATEPAAAASARKTRQTIALAAGIAAVVGIASFVGLYAGRITQRAPRGGGARIVFALEGDAGGAAGGAAGAASGAAAGGEALPARRVVLDQVRRAAGALGEAVTVVPDVELEARRVVLRGKGGAGTIEDAAFALGADAVAYVGNGEARVVRSGRRPAEVVTNLPSPTALALAIAEKAGARVDDAAKASLAAWRPPTFTAPAYDALLDGRYADAVAADPDCAPCLLHIGTKEALEKALGSPRLSRKEELLAEAAHASLALEAQTDPMKRAAVIEKILDIYRKMTVELPEEFEGHYNLGRTYHRLMNAHDESLHHLEAARRLVPTDLDITAEVADAWMHMADRKHAIQAVRGYLALFPNDAAAKKLLDDITNGPLPEPPPPPTP